MWKFIVSRVLQIVPFMLLLLFVLFVMVAHFPYDPVIVSLEKQGVDLTSTNALDITQTKVYRHEAKRLGQDLPNFYVDIKPSEIYAIPNIKWYGSHNKFHRWIGALCRLDFGYSTIDGRQVTEKVSKALRLTVWYMTPAVLLIMVLSLSLGIFTAKYTNNKWVKLLTGVMFTFEVMPLFLIATLAVMFLTTDYYGSWLNVFPKVDVYTNGTIPFRSFLLPVILIVLYGLSYYMIQIKNLHNRVHTMNFMTALNARGIDPKVMDLRHGLKYNAVAVIGLFAGLLPVVFLGRVVIEEIFNIPGIGRLLLDSVKQSDWNVVAAITLLLGLVKLLTNLLIDIAYVLADPRLLKTFATR